MNKFNAQQEDSLHNEKKRNSSTIWLRSKHVRDMLSISDSSLQSMRISGIIPAYKLGASWYYKEDEIIFALEAGSTKKKEVNNG